MPQILGQIDIYSNIQSIGISIWVSKIANFLVTFLELYLYFTHFGCSDQAHSLVFYPRNFHISPQKERNNFVTFLLNKNFLAIKVEGVGHVPLQK